MSEQTLDKTLNAIFERVPSIRAAFDDDIRKRRDAVTEERAALIDKLSAAEIAAAKISGRKEDASSAVKAAEAALERARRNVAEVAREQGAFLAVASAARKRLHIEFGNADVSAALFRVQSRLAQCNARIAGIEAAISSLRESNDSFRRTEISLMREKLETVQKDIPWVESAERELQNLVLAVMHPDDLRAEVSRLLISVFGIDKSATSDDQSDI